MRSPQALGAEAVITGEETGLVVIIVTNAADQRTLDVPIGQSRVVGHLTDRNFFLSQLYFTRGILY